MEFLSNGCADGVFKDKTIREGDFCCRAFCLRGAPEARWGPMNPLYGIKTSLKGRCEALGEFAVTVLGGEAFLDKSVFCRAGVAYGFGKGPGESASG